MPAAPHLSSWCGARRAALHLGVLLAVGAAVCAGQQRDADGDESPARAGGPPLALWRPPKGSRGRDAEPRAAGVGQGAKKRMLKALIRKLGEPCAQQCAGEEGVNGKECHGACEQRKMAKMKRFLATVSKHAKAHGAGGQLKQSADESPKAEARADDAARKKQAAAFFAAPFAKNKPSTRYPQGLVDIFGAMRPEIRTDVFKDSRELYCDGTDGSAVGPDGRVTGPPVVDPDEAAHLCAMCGGDKVLLWTPLAGRALPGVSANERRFFQSAPFESEERKRYAELVLSLLQPSPLAPRDADLPNRTMMSWSPDGALACVGFEEPPSAKEALSLLSLRLPAAAHGVGVCGLNNDKQLAGKDLKVVRIAQGAAESHVVPLLGG